jgi:hypothetical protein
MKPSTETEAPQKNHGKYGIFSRHPRRAILIEIPADINDLRIDTLLRSASLFKAT